MTSSTSNKTAPYKIKLTSELLESFFSAAEHNDLNAIKHHIIRNHIPVTTYDHKNSTAAHIAAQNGNLYVLRYLLKKKSSLLTARNSEGKNVLHLAVSRGRLKVVKYLVEKQNANIYQRTGMFPGNTAVHIAAQEGKLKMLAYFIEKKNVDVNVRNCLGETPIFSAASKDHLDVVEYLVSECKADPTLIDNNGNNILFISAMTGDVEIPRFLMKEKINLDMNWKNRNGECILHRAVKFCRLEFIKFILGTENLNLDVADNSGRTPLYEAVTKDYFDIAQYLIEKGADVKEGARDGRTGVDFAVSPEMKSYLESSIKARIRRSYSRDPELFVSSPLIHRSIPKSDKWMQKAKNEDLSPFGSSLVLNGNNNSQIDIFLVFFNICVRYTTGLPCSRSGDQLQYFLSPSQIKQNRMDPLAIDAIQGVPDFQHSFKDTGNGDTFL